MGEQSNGAPRRHHGQWTRVLLRTATLSSVCLVGALGVAALLLDGTVALLGVGVGGALVWGFYVTGNLVTAWALQRASYAGLSAVLVGYGLRIAVFGGVGWFMLRYWHLADVAGLWFAAGAAVAAMSWVGGLVFGDLRQNHPIYDREYLVPAGWEHQA